MSTPTMTAEERRLTERFAKPERHLARLTEDRTPAEQDTLLRIDEIVASYGMDYIEMYQLMATFRSFYRTAGLADPSGKQLTFLNDVSRSLDDLSMDMIHRGLDETTDNPPERSRR